MIDFAGKDCLITGGLGFIGSNLAHRLVALGASVHIVDSLIPGHGGNYHNLAGIEHQVTVTEADMRDQAMRSLVRRRDVIFNLAGQVSHLDSMNDPETDLQINCRSQMILMELVRHENPGAIVVYTSTRQIYGRPLGLPVSENHPIRPVDVNGVNNVAGEMYHLLYHDVYGIPTVSLRLTNTYGPRMLLTKGSTQGFITTFVRAALEGGEIMLYGDGEQRRDMNEVSDVVEALLRAASTPECFGLAFNLGHFEVVTLRQVAETLQAICPKLTIRYIPWPEEKKRIDIGDYYADFSRFSNATQWFPRVDLAMGLERMVEFYRENQEHYWGAS
ncbi:NAD-dependent epimerase/dehydratase family protein [Armatimonas sp.]|uniref:NAD-dependent epimerase/dehydratase family protein n=1 Tax=Armatimonas sp. TaxID=1872638 RepID=UPI00286BF0F0|nr:NAD-dependent epimerase/dehydratase family protein [Armatimonas sp.]